MVDPDIDFRPVLGILFAQHAYHGPEEIARWYGELTGGWDTFAITVERAIEAGDGVVAFLHLDARRGEAHLDAEIAVECAFTGDRISSVVGRDAWEVAEELGVPGPPGGGSML